MNLNAGFGHRFGCLHTHIIKGTLVGKEVACGVEESRMFVLSGEAMQRVKPRAILKATVPSR